MGQRFVLGGRGVAVKLMHDGPQSVTSDLWAMPHRRCQIRSQNYCMYSHVHWARNLSWGIDEVQQQMGNSVAYSMAVKIV